MSKKTLVFLMVASMATAAFGADRRHPNTPAPPGVPERPSIELADSAVPGSKETVSSLSALGFSPFDSTETYSFNLSTFFKYFTAIPSVQGADFGASIALPAGAVIDYVGLGSCDAAGGNIQIWVLLQSANGVDFTVINNFASSAHGATNPCAMDYNPTALGYQIAANDGASIQLDAYVPHGSPTDGSVLFGSVEVWWHTVVSPAPATPTFGDVPTTDFGFQYIEALAAAGITGGCGGGNYCPDNPVNRRQMAIFLAKALGLYWPN